MTTAAAMPGDTASTFVTNFFGCAPALASRCAASSLVVVPVLLPMAQTLRRRGDVADRRYHRRAGSGRDESARHRHGR